MPLNILLPMVVIGIMAITILVHLLGYSRTFRIDTDRIARDRWMREYDGDRITAVARCHDGRAALIETDQGPGLVWSFGADTVAHRITGADVITTADGLILRLHDFAAPRVRLRLDPSEAGTWREKLERLTA